MIRFIIIVLFVCFVSTSSVLAGTWRDDFEDGNLDGWEGLDACWTVEKGECSGEFAECCEIILTGNDWGKDYTVKCKMKFIGFPGCCAGINFRAIGDNAYTLFIVPVTNTIDGWKSPMISISKTPMPFVFSQDTWYEIEIAIKGNNIELGLTQML